MEHMVERVHEDVLVNAPHRKPTPITCCFCTCGWHGEVTTWPLHVKHAAA